MFLMEFRRFWENNNIFIAVNHNTILFYFTITYWNAGNLV